MTKSTTKSTAALDLGDPRLEALIMKTIHEPMSHGYLIRCYCRTCHRSYDTTKNGIKLLEHKNPEDPIVLPAGINDLRDEEQVKKCFLVLEPCFICREKGVKIITTAHLIPAEKSLLDQYSENPLNGQNKNQNGHSVFGHIQSDKSSVISRRNG